MIVSVVGKYARARAAWIAIAIAGLALGCRQVDNGAFCCTSADTCAKFGVTAPNGCAEGLVCDDAAHACLVPGTDHCSGPEDCSPALPFCVNQTCAQCDGAMGCSAAAPVCADLACGACAAEGDCAAYVASDLGHCEVAGAKAGQCVACRSGADGAGDCADPAAPICDQNACRGCTADSECASNVCDTSTGACVAENTVIYLAPGGSGTDCKLATPCGTFALGLAQVTGLRKTIKVGAGNYTEAVTIGAKTVTILGAGATLTPGAINGAGIVVTDGGNVRVAGLRITNAVGNGNADGLRCALLSSGPTPVLDVEAMMIDSNAAQGIDASMCQLTVRRSSLASNAGGGLTIAGGEWTVENNMIYINGGLSSIGGGVLVSQITTVGMHVLRFNTITKNGAGSGVNAGVECSSVTVPLAFSNSIVFGNQVQGGGKQVGGNNCSWTYSDISDTVNGMGNTTDDPGFADAGQNNYHLSTSSLLEDKADPAATLAVDFDGDVRPQGTARDIGADEITP
ncbi:MAG: hypothetical protein K8W52_13460 [Deltaproteobacteria bacterium]|nr:hypothetical protein [Deltaproteobacteria bacterium]